MLADAKNSQVIPFTSGRARGHAHSKHAFFRARFALIILVFTYVPGTV